MSATTAALASAWVKATAAGDRADKAMADTAITWHNAQPDLSEVAKAAGMVTSKGQPDKGKAAAVLLVGLMYARQDALTKGKRVYPVDGVRVLVTAFRTGCDNGATDVLREAITKGDVSDPDTFLREARAKVTAHRKAKPAKGKAKASTKATGKAKGSEETETETKAPAPAKAITWQAIREAIASLPITAKDTATVEAIAVDLAVRLEEYAEAAALVKRAS